MSCSDMIGIIIAITLLLSYHCYPNVCPSCPRGRHRAATAACPRRCWHYQQLAPSRDPMHIKHNTSNDTCAVMRYHWHWGRPYLGHTQHATTWIERAPSPDPDASMVVNDVPRDPVTNPKYSSLWPVFLFACFLCSPYFPCLPLEHGCVCRTRC